MIQSILSVMVFIYKFIKEFTSIRKSFIEAGYDLKNSKNDNLDNELTTFDKKEKRKRLIYNIFIVLATIGGIYFTAFDFVAKFSNQYRSLNSEYSELLEENRRLVRDKQTELLARNRLEFELTKKREEIWVLEYKIIELEQDRQDLYTKLTETNKAFVETTTLLNSALNEFSVLKLNIENRRILEFIEELK
jgi:hypothetical protein